jgi:hypothetical protein
MYLVMSVILVYPTFDLNVTEPVTEAGHALVAAMEEVGSPIGQPYIRPIIVPSTKGPAARQVVTVEDRDGIPTAVQRYGLIDSNLVKNFRNRLTAAALRLWNADLGDRAVTVEEHPWLPRDVPYAVYFGMALLPMTVFVSASMVGGILTAQEFEFGTIVEYRLATAPVALILGARLTRLVLTALLGAGILLVAIGLVNDHWPGSLWRVALILLPVAIIAGGLGMTAGLLVRKSILSFLVGLVASFALWLLGSAFGLAAGFGQGYEFVSRFTPNRHAVELLFPSYFDTAIGAPLTSMLVLTVFCTVMLSLTALAYRWRVTRQG